MPDRLRLLVVSHACVVAANQGAYASLLDEVDVHVVVPRTWRNEYSSSIRPEAAAGLAGRLVELPVVGRGRPQRHRYLARLGPLLAELRPDAVVVEEEPFSLAASQWVAAARRAGVPVGVQLAETLDRPLPWIARRVRDRVLANSAFVLARSARAAELAVRWGARGIVGVVTHSVPPHDARPEPHGPPTAAFVGRLVPAKGVDVLLDAIGLLGGRVQLVVAGDGPLRGAVLAAGPTVTWLGALSHDRIDEVYARAHVTCVPSRTTPTWAEQFGRVVVESLVRAVPVVASSSGELPWLLGLTGGGLLVPEGDAGALAAAIASIATDPSAAAALGGAGRVGVLRTCSDEAAGAALRRLVESALSAPRSPR